MYASGKIFDILLNNFLVYPEVIGGSWRKKGSLSYIDWQFPISYSYIFNNN